MRLKYFCGLMLSAMFVFSLSSAVNAEKLTVGLGELDYPPFYFVDEGQLTGAAVEIAEAVAGLSGYELTYERVPWTRLQYGLKRGSLDMTILYFKTDARALDVVYTDQPHIYENSFLVLPKHLQVEFSGELESLAQYEFFYVRGYSHGHAFDNASFLTKDTVNNETELLQRITSGRPFIGVGNKPALLLYAQKSGLENQIYFLDPPIDRGANYMAFSKMRPDAVRLAETFSSAFAKYSTTPAYNKVLKKYGFAVKGL